MKDKSSWIDPHQQKGCHMLAPWHIKLEPGPGISATATPGKTRCFCLPASQEKQQQRRSTRLAAHCLLNLRPAHLPGRGWVTCAPGAVRPAAQRMELLQPVCNSVAQLPHFTQVWNPKFPVGTGWGWGWDQCSRASPSRTEIKLLRYVI